MVQKILDFFETELGKKIAWAALGVLIAIVTISTYIITSNQDKKENIEASMTVADVDKEKVTKETKETTTQKQTETTTAETTTLVVEVESTEEATTKPVVIPMEDLNVSKGDDIGEDAAPQKKPNVVVEPEPETTTAPKEVEDETEEIVRPTDNHIPSAPQPAANEYACMVHGIDVSKWNGDIDWAKVKADGYNFVFIRCGYRGYESGALATDDKFQENIEGAQAAGLQVGVYFFSQAINEREAQEEASLVINMIKDYSFEYPVVFDWETMEGYRTFSGISVEKMNKIVSTFTTMIENEGYEAMIYGNKYDLQRFDYVSASKNYKIWHARYPAKYADNGKKYKAGEAMPELDSAYQIWQYTSTGTVNGIKGEVDLNVAFFSYEGSGVKNTTLKINVPNSPYVTNIGVPISDFYKDVTATNSAGIDATNTVTYIIYNEAGELVEESTLYDVAGNYEIAYYIKDFTGIPYKHSAELIVRGNPNITLKYMNLAWFDTTDMANVSADSVLAAFKENLPKLIADNILSASDYDGDDLTANVVIGEYILEQAVTKNGYKIMYNVKDDTGLMESVFMTISKASLISNRVEIKISELEGEDILQGINSYLLNNILVGELIEDGGQMPKPEGIEVLFGEDLLKDIENGTVNTGNEYEIKYVMAGMDAEKYYKNCTIVILDGMTEEATSATGESNSETTTIGETTGE